MEIKCWGSRGSISVSGKEFIKYGGSTTCIEVTAGSGETIILDAGTGIRKLGSDPVAGDKTKYYLLFTHVHWDHIAGFPFFKPLLEKNRCIEIQNNVFLKLTIKEILDYLMSAPFFPVTMEAFKATRTFRDDLTGCFSIGSIDIETIPLSHPGGGYGYKLTENNKTFVFLTDNELGFDHPLSKGFDSFLTFCTDADILFHDAEFTPEEYSSKTGWGHSSYKELLDLAVKAKVRQLGLFHINQERTDIEMDKIVTCCRKILQQKKSSLDCFGVAAGMHFKL
ncbi:MAG: MBL fold metallo-hydrolase [Desulfobacteraceae bacterium]